jgi:lysophospholipase L1-like esterase
MNQPAKRSTALLASVTIVISLTITYFIVEYALGWYQQGINNSSQQDPGLMRYHYTLGWTLSPGWQGRHQHHDFDVHYSTSAARQRNDGSGDISGDSSGDQGKHQVAAVVNDKRRVAVLDKDKRQVALLGDSFTFGFGVNDSDTFHARLNQQDPNRHYANLAVPGYSTDQQYLLLKQQPAQRYDQTLLMFYLGNDLLDNALAYPLQASKAKPYFSLQQGQLQLHNQPVPRQSKPAMLYSTTMQSIIFGDQLPQDLSLIDRLIQSSRLLSMLLPRTAASNPEQINAILSQRLVAQEQLFAALLQAIKTTSDAANSPLTLALLPGQSYVNAPRSYSAYFQEYVRQRVIAVAEQLDIEVIDVAGELRRSYSGQRWFFPYEGHFTVAGHQQVADILLRQMNLGKTANHTVGL